jgi:chromosome segregation ATPase
MSDDNADPHVVAGEYDGLIERLRDKWKHSEEDCYAAADALAAMQARVSELENICTAWSNDYLTERRRADAAQARIAALTEALTEIIASLEQNRIEGSAIRIARAALEGGEA